MQEVKERKIIVYDNKEDPMDPFGWKNIKKSSNYRSLILNWKFPMGISLTIFIILMIFLPFRFKNLDFSSQQYLLSSIFQGLAAVFALGITGMMVGIQIVDRKYSYRAVKYFPKKAWNLFGYIMWYSLFLVATLILLYSLNKQTINMISTNVLLIAEISISGGLIVYTGIKIWNILMLFEPGIFFEALYDTIQSYGKSYTYENYDDISEMFSEIILKALKEQQEIIASEGIKTLTYVVWDELTDVPKKENKKPYFEIYGKYYRLIELFSHMAAENGELIVLRQLVDIMCEISLTSFRNKNGAKMAHYPMGLLVSQTLDYVLNFKNVKVNTHFNYVYFLIDSIYKIQATLSKMIELLPENKEYSIDWIWIIITSLGDNMLKISKDENIYEQNFTTSQEFERVLYEIVKIFLQNDYLLKKRSGDAQKILNLVILTYLSKHSTALCQMEKYQNNGLGLIHNIWETLERYETNKNKRLAELLMFEKLNLLLSLADKLPSDSDCFLFVSEKFLELYQRIVGKSGSVEGFNNIIHKLDFQKIKQISVSILSKEDVPSDTKEYFKKLIKRQT